MELPFWFPKKENAIWFFLFILIFLLSMDLWAWNQSSPFIFGLPIWIIYILILTLSTSIAFFLLSKFYWREKQ
jgi:hypothetical protein